MKSRDEIITSMCYTWRHDYGIIKDPEYKHHVSELTYFMSSGMYQQEREQLWKQMAQLFDNDIAPYMELKRTATSRDICGNE
jgi:hypothetical protein